MKRVGVISMFVVILTVASFLPVVLAQETYTREQYIGMLPTLDKVDLSKMPVMPVGGSFDDLTHRTWYFITPTEAQAMLHNAGITVSNINVANDPYGQYCVYIWNLPDDRDFILVRWNKTTNQVSGVYWRDWETSWLYDNYPKNISDYSLQDLPTIKDNNSQFIGILAGTSLMIIGIGAVVYYKFYYEKNTKRRHT